MIHENFATLNRPFAFDGAHRPTSGIGRDLLGWALQLITWLENRRRLRRARNELMSLSDRDLADIGLTRADTYFAVRRIPAE